MKDSTNVLLIMVLKMLLIEASTCSYKVSSNSLKIAKMIFYTKIKKWLHKNKCLNIQVFNLK